MSIMYNLYGTIIQTPENVRRHYHADNIMFSASLIAAFFRSRLSLGFITIIFQILALQSIGFHTAHFGTQKVPARKIIEKHSSFRTRGVFAVFMSSPESDASFNGSLDRSIHTDLAQSAATFTSKTIVRKKKTPPEPRKSHCTTICAVPPSTSTVAWEALSRARKELRDPGFFRWPPHANLLYPFLEIFLTDEPKCNGEEKQSPLLNPKMLDSLSRAAAKIEPFEVTIDKFGIFGGKNRGVLWAYPYSRSVGEEVHGNINSNESSEFCNPSEPMIQLQTFLENEFPTCTEGRKQRQFHPHITLSHFENFESAAKAKEQVEAWWEPISYITSEIYLLQRIGDDGQFKIIATIRLGSQLSSSIQIHDPPAPFPGQPEIEEDWVNAERMALKARRNNNGAKRNRSRPGKKRRNRRNNRPKVPDTPEVIEAKRAARKAKREALEGNKSE